MQKNRFEELEGLRGLAAIMVALYHFLLAFYLFSFLGPGSASQNMRFEDNLYGNPIMVFLSGTFAVSIFFVLSGFVLSIGFFQTKDLNIIKKLAAKRYLRLMLPALVSTLICFFVIILGLSKLHEVAAISHSSWLANTWLFSPNLFDAVKSGSYDIFVSGSSPFNNVLWTMTTEFAGSFLVFGFIALFGNTKNRIFGYAFLILVTFNTWYFPFIAGMAIADLYAHGYITNKKRRLVQLLPVLGAVLFFAGYPMGNPDGTVYKFITFNPQVFNWQTIYLSFAAISLIIAILSTTQLSNFFKKPKISALGKYTFSSYLVHLIVLYTFGMAAFLVFYHKFGLGYNTSALLTLTVSVPIVVGATLLFEKYVDSPSIKLSSIFANILLSPESVKPRLVKILAPIRKTYYQTKKLFSYKKVAVVEAADEIKA